MNSFHKKPKNILAIDTGGTDLKGSGTGPNTELISNYDGTLWASASWQSDWKKTYTPQKFSNKQS